MAKSIHKSTKTNEALIQEFIEHLKLGKPILRQKKKPISETTASKYKHYLRRIDGWIGQKSFLKVDESDIDSFRKKLEDNVIHTDNGHPFARSVKRDIEYKILGCFFKWLGKPELIYYTDRYSEQVEIPALKREEVERMMAAQPLRNKVILVLLYDGGLRAEEFLNVRFSDIKDDERKSSGYYKVRVIVSKTKTRTVALMMDFSTEIIDSWLALNKEKVGTDQQFVDLTYNNLNHNIRNIGKSILHKRVYPHLLRHSSVTWYCHKLNQYQLNKRYGWSMGSRTAMIYIDREGIEEDESNKKIKTDEQLVYRKEVNRLREEVTLLAASKKATDSELESSSSQVKDLHKRLDLYERMLKELAKQKKGQEQDIQEQVFQLLKPILKDPSIRKQLEQFGE